jgi:hypothetical protein
VVHLDKGMGYDTQALGSILVLFGGLIESRFPGVDFF